VLVAVSEHPVGVDIEMKRPCSEAFVAKLTDEQERADFDFFELWVLRESLFKLIGKGNLRKMRFRRENGVIVPPAAGVRCRLYGDVPGCTAAVCCFEGDFPESIAMVETPEISS
jgi:phosphopantetheinyl transferase